MLAGEIYAAFEGLEIGVGLTYGIASYNAQTLHFDGSFFTDSRVTSLGYLNGTLYDTENGSVVLRNPTSGAVISTVSPQGGSYLGLATFQATEYAGENDPGFIPGFIHPLTNGSLGTDYGIGHGPLTGMTSGDGKLFESFNDSLVLSVPTGPDSISNTLGGSGGTTLGAIVYNPDSNIIQAAVDLVFQGTSVELKGVIDFRATDGMPIVNLFVPAGLDLGYEPQGLAFGLDSLYASDVHNIQRLDPITGDVLGQTGPTGITLGALLFVPEPRSIVLAALGFLGFVAWGRVGVPRQPRGRRKAIRRDQSLPIRGVRSKGIRILSATRGATFWSTAAAK